MSDFDSLYSLDAAQLEKRLLDAVGTSTWPALPDAIELARERHAAQQHKEGTDFLQHPLRAALILLEVGELKDPNLLCAAILLGIIEDTDTQIAEVEQKFGPTCATLVNAATVPPKPEGTSAYDHSMAHFGSLSWAPRDAQILCSADRIDKLKTIDAMSPERQAEYVKETRDGLLELILACNTALYHAMRIELEKLEATQASG